jgi:predicted transcriptional regulator
MKILLSIKPEYAEKIFIGEKQFEFRRNIFKNPLVKTVVIYASSPVRRIIGEFEIDYILSLDIGDLWGKTMHLSGINKEFYDNYFRGKQIGHAIKVKKVKRYHKHLELSDYDIKYAPQSFIYLNA